MPDRSDAGVGAAQWAASCSAGVMIPSSPCRRGWLIQSMPSSNRSERRSGIRKRPVCSWSTATRSAVARGARGRRRSRHPRSHARPRLPAVARVAPAALRPPDSSPAVQAHIRLGQEVSASLGSVGAGAGVRYRFRLWFRFPFRLRRCAVRRCVVQRARPQRIRTATCLLWGWLAACNPDTRGTDAVLTVLDRPFTLGAQC